MMTHRTQNEWAMRVGNARASGRTSGRADAVAEVLAAAIMCNDNAAAEVMASVAEHLARHFTPDEMSETKAHAVALVLALGDVPEPGPVTA